VTARALRPELTDDLDAHEDRWRELALRSGNVFVTPEWCRCWRRMLGASGRSQLILGRDEEGSIRAVWPVVTERVGPLRVTRLQGHGPSDDEGPACEPEDRPEAATLLGEALDARMLPVGLLLAECVPADIGVEGRVLTEESSPVLPVRGRSWDEFLGGRSRNFRDQVRRRRRRLERAHAVVFRQTSASTLDDDFDALLRLHAARWQGASTAFADRLAPFHRAFAHVALERGWLRLWTLSVDEAVVAAWYGFRFGSAELFYQSGRDPRWDQENIGFVLFARTVQAAFDDGLSEYRLLRGGEMYKDRWAEEDRPVLTVLAARGRVRNAAAATTARAARTRARKLGGAVLGRLGTGRSA
jgi:CelD/BcsL family acetyltransferase involved in cellulose biosynthesis